MVARLHAPIDARRAYEWGLVEEIGGDDAVERVVKSILAGGLGRRKHQALRASPRFKKSGSEPEFLTGVAVGLRYDGVRYITSPVIR